MRVNQCRKCILQVKDSGRESFSVSRFHMEKVYHVGRNIVSCQFRILLKGPRGDHRPAEQVIQFEIDDLVVLPGADAQYTSGQGPDDPVGK